MKRRHFKILSALAAFCLAGCAGMPEPPEPVGGEPVDGAGAASVFAAPPKSLAEKISGKMSLAEFYAELAFDPDGDSIYTVALKDPIGAYWASSVKDEALALVDELFPNRAQFDNEVDAFRHAYFSCRLAQEIGAERAKKFTDAYELHVVNSWGSRCMDLWNNREGRRIYADSPKSGKREFAKNEVIKAVKTKRLALSPFDIWREE